MGGWACERVPGCSLRHRAGQTGVGRGSGGGGRAWQVCGSLMGPPPALPSHLNAAQVPPSWDGAWAGEALAAGAGAVSAECGPRRCGHATAQGSRGFPEVKHCHFLGPPDVGASARGAPTVQQPNWPRAGAAEKGQSCEQAGGAGGGRRQLCRDGAGNPLGAVS